MFSKTDFPVFSFNINIGDVVYPDHKLNYGTKDNSEISFKIGQLGWGWETEQEYEIDNQPRAVQGLALSMLVHWKNK